MRNLKRTGSVGDVQLYKSNSDGTYGNSTIQCGVRLVVSLKRRLDVISGDGLTKATAFVLSN